MRYRLLPTAILIYIVAMFNPIPSNALASTCSTHVLGASSWSVQTDTFNGHWDFQCGGTTNDWQIVYELQKRNSDGTWTTPVCDNGLACRSSRPDSGWYQQGTEHTGSFTFNPAVQLNCKTWRIRGQAPFFDGSLSPAFFSLNYQIGGC